jgi:hypothetical protein
MERRVAEVFQAGDREELSRAYARWAERYVVDMLDLERRGPEIVASMTARYVQDRRSPPSSMLARALAELASCSPSPGTATSHCS